MLEVRLLATVNILIVCASACFGIEGGDGEDEVDGGTEAPSIQAICEKLFSDPACGGSGYRDTAECEEALIGSEEFATECRAESEYFACMSGCMDLSCTDGFVGCEADCFIANCND